MIEHRDSKKFAASDQSRGELQVLVRRSRVTARMTMRHDDRRPLHRDRRTENLARRNEARGERPDRNDLVTDRPSAAIEADDDDGLAVAIARVSKNGLEERHHVFRTNDLAEIRRGLMQHLKRFDPNLISPT